MLPPSLKRLLLAVLLIPAAGLQADEKKRIGLTTAEYPPYYSEKLDRYGPVAEIISEAFSRSGYDVRVGFYPWPRAELYARRGDEYAGMFTLSQTSEREQQFLYSEPLFPNVIGFYKRKEDHIEFDSLADLSPYSVGIVRGYANPEDFQTADVSRVTARNDKQNLIMLCNHRIDLALIDRVLAEYILQTDYSECQGDIEWISQPLEIKPQHLVISRKTPNAEKKMAAFNRGYGILREEGSIQRILKEHGVLEMVKEATDTLFP